ncbi:unnamed protein product [Darwinula stevensoni]|uniref:MPN domain-containing protein n=1 Tax=Darwinula stevensoni TaxID=69355 RepID=A0A7R9FU83_9CRUS|nr:unnamed protein product [Darwinula stevensoni]CAG0908779.1 unnamed protein product [Darwinula stevensoni]
MDVKSLSNTQLIAFAFGVGSAKAEESEKLFFPARGECFAMDSGVESLRERLVAAVEIDRRMALVEMEDVSSPEAAKTMLRRAIVAQQHESFWVVFMDAQNRVISTRELSIGTVSQCSVYPREIVKSALKCNASAVILAHNHPSGNSTPSRADEVLTKTIKAALVLVDVRVLDHFIVTRNEMCSMATMGLI